MRLLAISFMLPPMLYPQAIQIGRLLEGSCLELATLNGRFEGDGMSSQEHFRAEKHFIKRIEVPHRTLLNGMAHRLAMRLLPFYGRSPDEFLAWSQAAVQCASEWLGQNPSAVDLIASFGEPMSDHLVGLSLKRATGLPWLAHFSDPWVDNPFRSLQPLANWRNRQLEAAVVAEADSLVFTSDETRELVMRKYPASWRDKTFVLPHSFDPREFHGQQKAQPEANIVLRYLGNFYGHRTPFPLFLALDRLSRRNPQALQGVRVELVGSTPRWMRWHPALRRLPPGLVAFRSPVSYRHSLELMQATDLLLVIDAPARHSVFLPSKLVDYIGARKPIMGIVPPGASHQLISRMGGHTADPRAPHDVDSSLLEAIGVARTVRASGAQWGDARVRAGYEIARVAADFREMLEWTWRKGGV